MPAILTFEKYVTVIELAKCELAVNSTLWKIINN